MKIQLSPIKLVFLLTIGGFILLNTLWIQKLLSNQPLGPTTFTFALPIPPDVIERFKVSAHPEVQRVYMTGTFTHWDRENPDYQMVVNTNQQNSTNWSISLDLGPGVTEYKYVVFIQGRIDPVWVHDTSHPRKTPDGFQGFNSLHINRDLLPLLRVLNSILYITLVSFIIMSVLTGIKDRQPNPTIRMAGYTIFFMALLLSWIFITTYQAGKYIRQLPLEAISVYARLLLTHPKDSLKSKENLDLTAIDRLQLPVGEASPLFPHIFLLDTNLNLIAYSGFQNGRHHLETRPLPQGIRNLNQLIQEKLFVDFFHPNKILPLRISWPRYGPIHQYPDFPAHTSPTQAEFSEYEPLLYPLIINHKLQAYLGFLIQPLHKIRAYRQILAVNIIGGLALFGLWVLLCLKRLQGKTSVSTGSGFYDKYNITDREKDIIALVIKGANNPEIARRLFISEKTVKSHIYNIYQKVGIQNRVELINKINDHIAIE